jgi:hypothetical protein
MAAQCKKAIWSASLQDPEWEGSALFWQRLRTTTGAAVG